MTTVAHDDKQHTFDADELVVDRAAFSVVDLDDTDDAADERAYWWSRTPQERMHHLEYLRHVNYGDQASGRLQRVLEVVEYTPR